MGDLLILPRVVILAEAGAGKTEEMRATSIKLRGGRKMSFSSNCSKTAVPSFF